MHFTIGAVVGWLIVSFFYGRLLPAFSLPTFIAVAVGGTIGQMVGLAVTGGQGPDKGRK
jgi:hypothetical protein